MHTDACTSAHARTHARAHSLQAYYKLSHLNEAQISDVEERIVKATLAPSPNPNS